MDTFTYSTYLVCFMGTVYGENIKDNGKWEEITTYIMIFEC